MAFYADSVYDTEVTSSSVRLPWNNFIYPGNYVAALNAYRDQSVQALPGLNFFRGIGVLSGEALDTAMGVDNDLDIGTYPLSILSPDKRQDDKPRTDRPFIIRGAMGGGGIGIYRVGINTVNLITTATDATISRITASFAGDTVADGVQHDSLGGNAGANFPKSGTFSDFAGFAAGGSNALVKYTTSDLTVSCQVATNAVKKKDPGKEAAIIVEVCFFANAPAPSADEVDLPYNVESGQSTQ